VNDLDILDQNTPKERVGFDPGRVAAMRIALLALLALSLGSGCANQQLRLSTLRQTSTLPDVQQRQVIDNFARLAANSGALPYYAAANQGTIAVSDQGSASLLVTAVHKVFPSWATSLGLQRSITESWQTTPTNNPDRLKAMRAAYVSVVNPAAVDPTDYQLLQTVLTGDQSYPLTQGWLSVGTWRDVPKKACMVAHCGPAYVWVMPEDLADFSQFALLILHIETVLGPPATPAVAQVVPETARPSVAPPAGASPFAPRLFDQPPVVNSGLFFVPRPF
jgi:hypothetical protein